MTSKFDWSQFTESEPSKNKSFDWSQFAEKEKESPALVPSLIEKFQNPPFKKSKMRPTEAFGEFNKKLGQSAKEYGELAVEHPWETAGSLGVGFGKAVSFPVHAIESWLRNEGIIDENTPPNLISDYLNQASSYLQQNMSPEEQRKLEKLEELGGVLPIGSAISSSLKGAKGLFKKIPSRPSGPSGGSPPPSYRKGPDTFESGLTKPRAVESKHAEKAIISPSRQSEIIESLDKEASKLTRKSLEKHIPISKEVESGFDFRFQFEKEFNEVKKLAEKFNPEINISPISKFMKESRNKFKGIPDPHTEAKFIIKSSKKFATNPPRDLKSLLRTFRSNNRKRARIHERARLHGHLKEYDDFLGEYNQAIEQSIKETLPADSPWFKKFKESNEKFSKYRNAEDTLNELEPILREDVDSKSLRKLAYDKRKQQKLRLKMGKQGADEVIQIGKDLDSAIKGVKRMKAKEISKFDAIFPLALLIPGAGKVVTLARAANWTRRAYGYMLSKPASRKYLDEAVKAVSRNDIAAYQSATEELKLLTHQE